MVYADHPFLGNRWLCESSRWWSRPRGLASSRTKRAGPRIGKRRPGREFRRFDSISNPGHRGSTKKRGSLISLTARHTGPLYYQGCSHPQKVSVLKPDSGRPESASERLGFRPDPSRVRQSGTESAAAHIQKTTSSRDSSCTIFFTCANLIFGQVRFLHGCEG